MTKNPKINNDEYFKNTKTHKIHTHTHKKKGGGE